MLTAHDHQPTARRPRVATGLALSVLLAAPMVLHAQQVTRMAHAEVRRDLMAVEGPTSATGRAPMPRRVVGEFAIGNARRGFPQRITLADSAGQLVASYRTDGSAQSLPMRVEVIGADLRLQAETSAGPLVVDLEGQNAPAGAAPAALRGRWQLRHEAGVLRGRVQR